MIVAIFACLALIASTTTIHYEVLRFVNARLASLGVPSRSKVLVVIFAAFVAHALEIAVYGAAVYFMVRDFGLGTLSGTAGFSFQNCLYFSAETYTSLGFGDLTPVGPVRLLAGVEALNGLLLIGWSASFTYIAMERFWSAAERTR
jgi:Ion channel